MPSNLQLHFKEFINIDPSSVYRQAGFRGIDRIKKTPDYVWDLFVYEPRTVEEARLGNLFMLGKIENIPKDKYRNFDFLLNLLTSAIKRDFYSDPSRPTLEAFEAGLNKANLYLADFTEKGNVEWLGNLHFVCGAFSQNTLHVTKVGEPIIKLFRETTVGHIENKFPIQKKPHPLKTFGNIASGTIINGDKIILGTKDILDIASLTSLKELFKEGGHQVREHLKRVIENKINTPPLICLILEAKTEAPEEIAACLSINQTESESPIIKRVSRYRKIKSVALGILLIFRKILKAVFIGVYRTISFLIFIFKKIFKLLTPLLEKISAHKLLSSLFSKIKPPTFKLKVLGLKIIEKSRIKYGFQDLKQNKPVLFVVSLLVLFVLILPFSAIQKINHHAKIKGFNELSAEIEEIQKKTDIALIYQEKERARGLIQKNQILLASLLGHLKKSPLKNNNGALGTADQLQQKHQEQSDSVNNIKRIKELKEILDFSKTGFIVNPVEMEKIENNLYFYELESGILYKFNLAADPPAGGKGLILIFISAKDELRKMIALENAQIVLFGQSGKAYLYDSKTNEYSVYLLDPAISIEQIKDVKSFLSNFYLLDAEQGNVIKYLKDKESTLKGSAWLSEPAEELKNAKSMAIDGSVYVLNSDDLIIKYYKGEKVEEINPRLETSLDGNNKIFVMSDFKNFYISDPNNKRLIVLNKQGEVINQYINDELANLNDFWITKDEKEIYLLCGKKVYKINL